MKIPLVSIQIPTYNQKEYIIDSVESAILQDYKNKQIIVSDDLSSDYDAVDFLTEYNNDKTVEIHINNENKGRVKNYHDTLYNLVKGKYFINLDGDDYLIDESFISYGVSLLELYKNHNPVVFEANHDLNQIKKVIPNHIVIDENSIILDGKELFKNLPKIRGFFHAACIFNTEKAKSIGFYNIESLAADFNSTIRLYFEGSVILSSKKVAQWRKHENNASWTINYKNYKTELFAIQNVMKTASQYLSKKELKHSYNITIFGLYKNFVLSLEKNKDYKNLVFFVLKNSKFSYKYIRVLLGLVKRYLI